MMATYAVALDRDLDDFNDYYSGDDDYDNDASDVEDEMDALEGAEPGTPEWKQLIATFDRPAARQLGAAYRREAQDPKHRMGDLLQHCFQVYERKNPGDPTGRNFYHWLDNMADWDRTMMIVDNPLVRERANQNIKPSMVKAFMKGVAYLDRAGRKSHRVHFTGGSACFKKGDRDIPLDTSQMSTVFSGNGFGIWVISGSGKLYVGNHVKGMIHHSSFLAGADVMCGGELWARNGKITFLTAKSGHYNPGTEHLAWALRVLETCVDNFDHIKVMAWRIATDRLLLVAPHTIMWDTVGYYSAWGKITAEEMNRLRAGNFGSFPDH